MPEEEPEPEPPDAAPTAPIPFIVKLAAGLLILSGLDGVADIILAILGKDHEGRLFNLFFLLIGVGLLRRSPNALGCTTALFGLLAVAVIASLVSMAIPSCRDQMVFEGPILLNASVLIGLGAISTLFLYWLRVPNVREDFSVKPSEGETREARSWAWVLAIVAGSTLLEVHLNEIEHRKIVDAAFHFDTSISAYDADTGDPAGSVTLGYGPMSSSDGLNPEIGMTPTGKAHEWRVSGLAFSPIVMRIEVDDYEQKEVTITSDTKDAIRIELERVKSKEAPPNP